MRSRIAIPTALMLLALIVVPMTKSMATEITTIRVRPDTPAQLEMLAGFEAYGVSEIPPHRLGRSYDFELPDFELVNLASLGLPYEIIQPNRNVWNDEDYVSYQEMHDLLLAVVADHPDIAVMENLGVSTRDGIIIWGLKLSDNPGLQEDEPDVHFDAVIHAREPVNLNIIAAFIEQMTDGYGTDPDITALIDDTEIWITPIMNPEGYLYVETGIDSPWWRKNKRDNDEDGDFEGVVYESCGSEYPSYPDGVDLNRNYQEGWSSAGSSAECSIVYRGPAYFSENESQLQQTLFAREQMVAAISFHSYSQYVGYCGNHPAGIGLCHDIAGSILKENGATGYDAEFFYGNGQTYNWMYWEQGVEAYLIETATEFFPSGAARINDIVANNLNGMRTLLDRVHGNGIHGHAYDAVTLEPLVAEVAISNDPAINQARTTEPEHGRFWRLLVPGIYSVTVSLEGYHSAIIEDLVVLEGVPLAVEIPLYPLTVGVGDFPTSFALEQNHPNPFSPSTAIRYTLSPELAGADVELCIYDLSGRRVRRFDESSRTAGIHTLNWDGRDEQGFELPAGVYLYRLRVGEQTSSRKMLLAR